MRQASSYYSRLSDANGGGFSYVGPVAERVGQGQVFTRRCTFTGTVNAPVAPETVSSVLLAAGFAPTEIIESISITPSADMDVTSSNDFTFDLGWSGTAGQQFVAASTGLQGTAAFNATITAGNQTAQAERNLVLTRVAGSLDTLGTLTVVIKSFIP